jgi:hypothetical protein
VENQDILPESVKSPAIKEGKIVSNAAAIDRNAETMTLNAIIATSMDI